MNSDISLQMIFDQLLERGLIQGFRIGPMKTAIKQYAQILDYKDAAACPSAAFMKPDRVRNRLIDEKAPQSLGIHGLRNLKNNVSFLLRTAISLKLISPSLEFASWKESKPTRRPKRNEARYSPKYVLDPVPNSLDREFAEYQKWSTKIVNRERPSRLFKRPNSFHHHRDTLLRAAGYLVNIKGLKAESITLLTLIESKNAIDYLEWYIEQRGKHTFGSVSVLSCIIVLARYLEIIVPSSKQRARIQQWILEIGKFRSSLRPPVKVEAKEKRWLSIDQLEMVGRSIYPLNARRIQELGPQSRRHSERCLNNENVAHRTFRGYAYNVLQSLLIRLTVRIPLRQRNLREMQWTPNSLEEGQNLYHKGGAWHIRFRGKQLKIAQVQGEENLMDFEFPADLVKLLEEWLYKWRPFLIAVQRPEDQGKERITGGHEFVFLNSHGCPLSLNNMTQAFESATHKFTGVAVNPHMFRTIFATEYIRDTNNYTDAAYMLGDCEKTVIERYAKLDDGDCAKRASKWITRRLERGEGNKNGEEEGSRLPKLKYRRRR